MALETLVAFDAWLDAALHRTLNELIRLIIETLVAGEGRHIGAALTLEYAIRAGEAVLCLQQRCRVT